MSPAAAIAFKKIGDFFSKPSGIVVLVVVAILLYVYFKGKSAGKRKAMSKVKEELKVKVDQKLLTTDTGQPWSPRVITDRIYDDIYSGIFTPRDVEVYQILLVMPDEKIKAVANDWLDRYFDEDQETLKVAISREGGVAAWRDVRDSVIAKLTSLGIK